MRYVYLIALFLTTAPALGEVEVTHLKPKIDENEIIISLDFGSDVSALRAGAVLMCDQYAADKKVNLQLRAEAEGGGAPTEIVFKMPTDSAQRSDFLVCSASSTASEFRTTPQLTLDVSSARKLAEAERKLHARDDDAAKRYAPPRRVFFRRVERMPGKLIVYFGTPSFGSVQARIKGGQEKPPSTPSTEHRFEFDNLVPSTYEIEAWVVDATNREVSSSRTDMDDQGKLLRFVVPENPGKVGLSDINVNRKSDSAIFTFNTDDDASVRVTARKVIDRTTGKYGRDLTADEALAEGKRSFRLMLNPLEADSEYDYSVTTINPYGEQGTSGVRSFKTLPRFAFKSPVEISLTPVGFIVGFETTDVPDAAGLRVKGKNFSRENSPDVISGNVVKLSLSVEDTKTFLKAGDNQPTLEIYAKKGEEQEIVQNMKIAFEQLESTKRKIRELSISDPEREALIKAIEEVSKKKWGETWGNIIPSVFKLALQFLVVP